MERLILGSRGSALALAQVELTQKALAAALPELETEVKIFVTRGDKKLDLSLLRSGEAGGKGLFTKELEDALLAGEIDVAIHSLKDLPGNLPPGLELAAVLERAATGDTLLAKTPGGLEALPQGARVGTSSIRRARQLQWRRPDLEIVEWRGNVQTRLRKLGASAEISGIVLAQAGLERLGFVLTGGTLAFEEYTFHVSSLAEHLLPAIGQGAIALESAIERPGVHQVLEAINHAPTLTAVRAERELQRLLSGDCTLPVGICSSLLGDRLHLRGILFGESMRPAEAEAEGDARHPEALAGVLFERLCRPAL